MNYPAIEKQLILHEGEKFMPYLCKSGKTTIGIGHNLTDGGITKEMSRFIFKCDLQACVDDLQRIFPGQFDTFPDTIQHVLIDMRFQHGHTGFRGYKKMIPAVRKLDLVGMVREMKDSVWYHKFPGRANRLIKMVEDFI